MRKIRVCTQKWRGKKKEAFIFDATTSAKDVSITQDGTTTFPFQEGAPVTITATQTKRCHLIDERGTFTYYAEPCGKRRKPHPLGNPRIVVIG